MFSRQWRNKDAEYVFLKKLSLGLKEKDLKSLFNEFCDNHFVMIGAIDCLLFQTLFLTSNFSKSSGFSMATVERLLCLKLLLIF